MGRPSVPPKPRRITELAGDLHQTGLKATLPRMRILALFQRQSRRHWHVDDVYRALQAEGMDIGVATIYRVLAQFEQAGVLRRSRFDFEPAVYELNEGEHHDHIVCVRCGRVVEFVDADIERRQQGVASARGYELVDHSLALFGKCEPACGRVGPAPDAEGEA